MDQRRTFHKFWGYLFAGIICSVAAVAGVVNPGDSSSAKETPATFLLGILLLWGGLAWFFLRRWWESNAASIPDAAVGLTKATPSWGRKMRWGSAVFCIFGALIMIENLAREGWLSRPYGIVAFVPALILFVVGIMIIRGLLRKRAI